LRRRTGVTAPVSSGGHDEARQGEVHDLIGFKKGGAHQVLDGNPQRKGGAAKLAGGEVQLRRRRVLLQRGHHDTMAGSQHTASMSTTTRR
jgi:hypothetical protein